MPNISCKKFTDYLVRRAEHFDTDIIRDITPTQGWVGHVSTGMFPPGDGVTRQFDKFHRVYPDLSEEWADHHAGHCVGTPCDPTETEICFGYTQEEYRLQEKSFKTQLFCFDLILSADRAKEQFGHLVGILRDATSIIMSDRMRVEAFRISQRKVVSFGAAAVEPFTYVSTGNLITMTPTVLPTGILTVEALQRFVQPLILEGYGGTNPLPAQMFEFVTDFETAWNLREGNPNLTNSFQFTDFAQGGKLYKYGITDAVGNFGIRIDPTPLRFLEDAGVLYRVFPYQNQAAAGGYGGAGIQGVVNDDYIDAPIQVDHIWHRMSMKSLVRDTMQINPAMPFAQRDFGGKWQFVMDNLGTDGKGCVIENKRRNKGMFIADFALATKPERPEWAVSIMHLRQRSCPKKVTVCTEFVAATFQAQNYSSACEPCVEVHNFGVWPCAQGQTMNVVANTATCNGAIISHEGATGIASVSQYIDWLNATFGELGVFTLNTDDEIVFTSSICWSFTLPTTACVGT